MTEPTPFLDPRELLRRHGLFAKKHFGQNFLVDVRVLETMADACGVGPGDPVLEIGPGLGVLTHALAARGARVLAVERDPQLVPILRDELGDRITLVEGDALAVDLFALAREHLGVDALPVVGNLPYHLTSPLVGLALDAHERVPHMAFMLQREVAERLVAPAGTEGTGVLSVLLEVHYTAKLVRRVRPGSFLPPPKVESAIVRFERRAAPAADIGDPRLFRAVVKAAFGQRRKTARNALGALGAFGVTVAEGGLDAALEEAGVAPLARGETLPIEVFARLSRALRPRVTFDA